jgi:hypothetical protein
MVSQACALPSHPHAEGDMDQQLWMVTVGDRWLLAGPSERLLVFAPSWEQARVSAASELGCALEDIVDVVGAELAGVPMNRLKNVA